MSGLGGVNNTWREGEIDHNLGKFWWEHADEGVAFWPLLVAFGVGGDVLCTNAFADDNSAASGADNDEFYFVWGEAEFVVVGGGGGERGFGVRDEAKADGGFFKFLFQEDAGFLDVAGGDVESVGADAEGDFSTCVRPFVAVGLDDFEADGVPIGSRELKDDPAGFLCATEVIY